MWILSKILSLFYVDLITFNILFLRLVPMMHQGSTALMMACAKPGNVKVVNMLLAKGADKTVKDRVRGLK